MPELVPAVPGSPEWLTARRAGVTATDIVTILGLSSYDSAYSLYWRKLGQVPAVEDNDRMRLGRDLESYVADRWAEDTGVLIRKAPGMYAKPVLRDGGLYQNDERAWQLATLDRIRYEGKGDVSEPVEVKTWADADRHAWQDGPPARVRAQVLWQMDVMGVATGHVGVLFLPSGEFRSYVISHDPDTGATGHPKAFCSACADLELMRAAGLEFYDRLMYKLPPPDLDASAATLAAVKARFAKDPDKEAEVDADVWQRWSDARIDAKFHEELARGYEAQLREQAGQASVLTVDGEPVARRVVSEQQVKAHTRHMDYLKRIGGKTDE